MLMPSDAACRLSALGIVTALGSGGDEVWSRLLDGEPSRLVDRADLVPDRVLRVGAVHDPLPRIPARLAAFDCRNNAMALAALAQIEEPIARALREHGAERVGVVMGTSTSGVADAEGAIRHELSEGGLTPTFDYAQLEFGGLASFAADYLGVRGPAYSLSTACSSGARALASARSLLRLGVCDAVIAGAADSLCGLTANGFTALSAVCDGVTNPCSKTRAGLTLGEGAAVFLVEPGPGGVQLYGVGESSEAHHMSAPDPSGAGAEVSMRGALEDAGLGPEDGVSRGRARVRARAAGLLDQATRRTHARRGGRDRGRILLARARSRAVGRARAAAALVGRRRRRGAPGAPPGAEGRDRAPAFGAARDDELVRLRRQQLHTRAGPRRGTTGDGVD